MGAALVSAALVWWATGPWGPGLSPDAIAYASIAENIRDHGEVGYWLEPSASSWPPLFPALLALVSTAFDISVVDAGRVVNVVCQGCTVVVVALIARRILTRTWFVVLAVAAAAVAQPLVYVAVKVWSEPLFNLLVLCLALALSGVPGDRPRARVVGAGALVVAAFLTRYAGLVLVPASVVVLLIWPRTSTARDRALRAGTFGVPALLAGLALVVWNRVRTGETFGPRWRPDEPFWAHAADGLASIGGWFLPTDSARALAILFGLGVLLAIGLALHRATRPPDPAARVGPPDVVGVTVVLAAFSIAYFGYMVWARTTSGFDPLSSRLMLPIFLPAVLLVLSLADRLASAQTSDVARAAVLALPLVLLTPTVLNGLDELRASHDTGNEYTNAAVQDFRQSPVLSEIPAGCALLSNDPWLLWLTGREAQLTPEQDREVAIPPSMELEELPARVGRAPTCLVWFATGSTVFYTPESLQAVVDVDELATDGFTTIYRLSPSG